MFFFKLKNKSWSYCYFIFIASKLHIIIQLLRRSDSILNLKKYIYIILCSQQPVTMNRVLGIFAMVILCPFNNVAFFHINKNKIEKVKIRLGFLNSHQTKRRKRENQNVDILFLLPSLFFFILFYY